MNIALITIWHIGNYGAEMQAYATYKALKMLGHTVSLVDFRLDDSKNVSTRIKIIKKIERITPSYLKFKHFWKKCFNNDVVRYTSLDELRNNPPIADMYLVGSDQVWNESITRDKGPLYFLDFGDNATFRASFSSSIGTNQWNSSNYLKEIAKKRLKTFCGISCRELTAVEVIKKEFEVDHVYNTLDPTLLFLNYDEITGIIQERRTLAYYPLHADDVRLIPLCNKLSKKLDLELYNVNPYTNIPFTNLTWNRNSVNKWIRSIAESNFVVTQSFHGMAFSLIYQKQFIVINISNNGRQSRIIDLLKLLNLEERYFNSIEEASNIDFTKNIINYEDVNNRLNVLRAKSFEYLKMITSL